jgi:hypothetical protein
MIVKARRAAVFFSVLLLSNLSLRSALFLLYMLGQHYSLYFESMFIVYFFNKLKKNGVLKGCRGLLFYNFQISYVCLTDVSVYDAFIHLPLYN